MIDIREKLQTLQKNFQSIELQTLFAIDDQRAKTYSQEAAGIFLDYSKNLFDSSVLEQLLELTQAANLQEKIQDLFAGKSLNNTENRPALHMQLREPLKQAKSEIAIMRQRMQTFSEAIIAGKITGFSGKSFTNVISIGIGGSDLGPKLVCEALKHYQNNSLNFHFISNVDDYHLIQILKNLKPETTLFIITSKSFTTIETLLNMQTAKQWFINNSKTRDGWKDHFVAVTANTAQAKLAEFKEEFIFPFWDWVGGRYSLWSTVGLSIALCIGAKNFEKFLAGAHAMDNHFKESNFNENMPVILSLLEIWYSNFWHAETQAIIPYAAQLNFFPSYLQQLIMESNGKNVSRAGEILAYKTSPIIWGEAGTNCQHSFMQLLHQSQRLIPVDFIAVLTTSGSKEHHQQLLANCFSQARVLMTGKDKNVALDELNAADFSEADAKKLAPHKVLPGNRPSNMLILQAATPETIGALIALYEHKVFSSAMIWNINPFDQWGVEMGKQVATTMLPKIKKNELFLDYDTSTNQLIELYRNNNEKT